VGGIPLAPIEDSDCCGVIFGWEGAEEADEADFVVDLVAELVFVEGTFGVELRRMERC
jgi:hypothetical protein